MRRALLGVLLVAAASTPGPAASPDDVVHAAQFADRAIYCWGAVETPANRARTFRDLWAACQELLGDRAPAGFRVLVVIGWQENALRYGPGDGGLSWGPWQLQDYEVAAAARRLGKPDAGAWARFRRDRTYCVWISIEHYRWLLERNGWQPRRAAMAHYAGERRMEDPKKVRAYLPITIWYYDTLWSARLPWVLTPGVAGL